MSKVASQPQPVRRAAICLWISAALTLLAMTAQLLGWVSLVGASPGMTVAIGLCAAALLGVVAAGISARRGWARWLFAVVYVFGIFGTMVMVVVTPDTFRALPGVLQANTIAQFILQTVALIYVQRSFTSLVLDSACPNCALTTNS